MLSVEGIYENGKLILSGDMDIKKPLKVIVTFLDEVDSYPSKKLDIKSFSFNKSRELLKDYKGSLCDALIEERRTSI